MRFASHSSRSVAVVQVGLRWLEMTILADWVRICLGSYPMLHDNSHVQVGWPVTSILDNTCPSRAVMQETSNAWTIKALLTLKSNKLWQQLFVTSASYQVIEKCQEIPLFSLRISLTAMKNMIQFYCVSGPMPLHTARPPDTCHMANLPSNGCPYAIHMRVKIGGETHLTETWTLPFPSMLTSDRLRQVVRVYIA